MNSNSTFNLTDDELHEILSNNLLLYIADNNHLWNHFHNHLDDINFPDGLTPLMKLFCMKQQIELRLSHRKYLQAATHFWMNKLI